MAQKIAAGLAEFVGLKIKELRPEHTLSEIANWVDNRICTQDLIKVLHVAFGVLCDSDTTFRSVVEEAAKIQAKKS